MLYKAFIFDLDVYLYFDAVNVYWLILRICDIFLKREISHMYILELL